jgi:hypothetical protein
MRAPLAAGTTNVLAVAARLGILGQAQESAYEKSRQLILNWLDSKGFKVGSALDNAEMETPSGEVIVESDGTSLWTMRFDDRHQMEKGAFWRVELTLLGGDGPAIGARISQIRKHESAPPPEPSSPHVLRQIASTVGLYDRGMPLLSQVWTPAGEHDIKRLVGLLEDPARIQPVIAVSIRMQDEQYNRVERIAERLTGVAHVVVVDADATKAMVNRFGKNRAVYGRAIRLYQPGFGQDSDPFNSPLWSFTDLHKGIVGDILEQACAMGLTAASLDERVPTFQAVCRLIVDSRLAAARRQMDHVATSADEERVKLSAIQKELEAALATYKAQVMDVEKSALQLKSELQAAKIERDDALDEVRRLQYQINASRQRTRTAGEYVLEPDPYPDSWGDVESWINSHGNGRLVLLPQAIKAARDSNFVDIEFVCHVLEFLAEHYVPMRLRRVDDDDARRRYEEAKVALGLDVSPVGDALKDRRYAKSYKRHYSGTTITLDQHVKGGDRVDPTRLFRLYFWYDQEQGQVVIGHFPTHLTNRLTHH